MLAAIDMRVSVCQLTPLQCFALHVLDAHDCHWNGKLLASKIGTRMAAVGPSLGGGLAMPCTAYGDGFPLCGQEQLFRTR